MTAQQQPQHIEPIESHRYRAESYDVVQRWASEVLRKPAWADMAVTVSFTRGAAGGWNGHLYGFPASWEGRGPRTVDESHSFSRAELARAAQLGRDEQPLALAETLDEVNDALEKGRPFFIPRNPPTSGERPGPDRWPAGWTDVGATDDQPQPGGSYVPSPVVDLGMIASGFGSSVRAAADADAARHRAAVPGTATPARGAVNVVNVTPEMMGSFFVPGPATDRPDDAPAFGGPALELDLDEAPKETRRSRRAAARAAAEAERSRRASARAAVDQTRLDLQRVAARGPLVPPSGHRPDGVSGMAPVEYPLCESTQGKLRCTRRHIPGMTDLVHTNAGHVWRDPETDGTTPTN